MVRSSTIFSCQGNRTKEKVVACQVANNYCFCFLTMSRALGSKKCICAIIHCKVETNPALLKMYIGNTTTLFEFSVDFLLRFLQFILRIILHNFLNIGKHASGQQQTKYPCNMTNKCKYNELMTRKLSPTERPKTKLMR